MFSRRLRRLYFALSILGLIAARSSYGQFPSLELHALSRCGGEMGTSFELKLKAGIRTDEVDRIYFSHPGIVGEWIADSEPSDAIDNEPDWGRFRVSIGEEVPPGLYDVRVQGRFGLSNSRAFVVSREPWRQIESGTDSPTAAPLPLNEWVQDECRARYRRYYRVNISADKKTRFRILTASIDSRARLSVALLDPSQRAVARAEVIENQDTQFDYAASETGTHTLVVSDHLYRGGPEFPYAIHASSIEASAEPVEWARREMIDEWKRVVSLASHNDSPVERGLSLFRLTPSTLTLRMPFDESSGEVHDESRYSDRQACRIEVPSVSAGYFDSNRDQDWFEFVLEAKRSIAIEVISERLGQLTDPQLIAYRVEAAGTADEKLHRMAVADDLPNVGLGDVRLASRDSVLHLTASESGTYRVMVRDQQSSDARGNRRGYLLEIRPSTPDFIAVSYWMTPSRDIAKSQPIAPTLVRAGRAAINVALVRHDGWQGAAEVEIDGLPRGVTAEKIVLGAEQSSAQLILTASSSTTESISRIAIRTTALVDGQPIAKTAIPVELIWGPIETQKAPVARLIAHSMLAVEERDQIPLRVQFGGSDLLQVARGEKLKIPLKVERSENAKQPITVRLRNPPPKSKANDVTINADAEAGEMELSVPPEAPLGEYSCWTQCESKVKLQLNPQSLDRAQKRLSELQSKKSDIAPEQIAEIDQAIHLQQEKVKQMEQSAKLQEFTLQLPSSSIRLRIVEKP